MKSGYLYIIINPIYKGWVKIGTTGNLKQRLHTYQTGDPFRKYTIIFSLYHPKFREAEKILKTTMKPFSTEIKGEWYKVDLNMAKSRLHEVLESYHNDEWGMEF